MPGKSKDAGLHNIRKRARLEKQRRASAPRTPASAPEGNAAVDADKDSSSSAPSALSSTRRNSETKVFRLRTDQVDKQAKATQALKREFIGALKEASLCYKQQRLTGGPNGTKGLSAALIADQFNAKLGGDVQRLMGTRIRDHVAAGFAGLSPPGKGPKPRVPDLLVDLVASHTSMSQMNGNELKPRAIRQNVAAIVAGTELEQHLRSKQQRAKFLKRLRQSGGLSAVPKVVCDNRRWMYLTYNNVNRYFDGLKYFYLAHGFGEDEPEVQPDGSTAEITMSMYMRARTSNGDETHQRLSNVGDKSGSRATTYINPLVVRSGSRKVECQKHITAYIIVNGADEVGPFCCIFDTTCDDENDRKINVGWTAGLPRVNCQFGFEEITTCEPVVLVTPKGGTSEDALEKIIETLIIPLYPDLAPDWIYDDDGNIIGGPIVHRLDGGPGRTGQLSLPMRMRMAEKGVYLFPSGPANCTAACQECDQLFGEYKQVCDEVTDEIISERITKRAAEEALLRNRQPFVRADGAESRSKKDLTKVELTNNDLPRIVNGRPSDPVERRPFSRAFSREKVNWGNKKVGAVPLTRAALKNPKVRQELEEGEEAIGVVQQIAQSHAQNLARGAALGLNTDVVLTTLPRRLEVVAPPTSEEEVIRKLVDGRCSQTSMWVNCGAVAFNSKVMTKAGCAIVQAELDAKMDKAASKLATFTELRSAAQAIVDNMRDRELVTYDSLRPGEPKTLLRFYFTAKGESGIAKYTSVAAQVAFLDGLEEGELEELLMLEQPPGYEAPNTTETAANQMLKKMSDSTRRTIECASSSDQDVLQLLNIGNAAADPVGECEQGSTTTIDAAKAGFFIDSVPAGTQLEARPPLECVLQFKSEDGNTLKGREILYNFANFGWFRGRILKKDGY